MEMLHLKALQKVRLACMLCRWASLDDGADSDRQRERKRKKARFTEVPKVSSKSDQVGFVSRFMACRVRHDLVSECSRC
jgi:hypothetical protein